MLLPDMRNGSPEAIREAVGTAGPLERARIRLRFAAECHGWASPDPWPAALLVMPVRIPKFELSCQAVPVMARGR